MIYKLYLHNEEYQHDDQCEDHPCLRAKYMIRGEKRICSFKLIGGEECTRYEVDIFSWSEEDNWDYTTLDEECLLEALDSFDTVDAYDFIDLSESFDWLKLKVDRWEAKEKNDLQII